MIVSGAVWPGEAPVEEEHRQIDLCVRNQGLIAASFASAGFVTVIDYVITSRRRVDQYLDCLPNTRVHLVTLDPGILVALERDRRRPEKTVAQFWTHLENEIRRELSGTGLWIDNSTLHIEEIVQLIREQAPQSIVN